MTNIEEFKKEYLKQLFDACDLNDVFRIPAAQAAFFEDLSISNIYTKLPLVSHEEYREKRNLFPNVREGNDSLDVDQLIRKIDYKIYCLEVEELVSKNIAEKKEYCCCRAEVKDIGQVEGKELPLGVKDGYKKLKLEVVLDDGNRVSKTIIVKAAATVIAMIQKGEVYDLKGYTVTEKGFNYVLLDPSSFDENLKTINSDMDEELFASRILDEKSDALQVSSQTMENPLAYVVMAKPGGGKTTFLKSLIRDIIQKENKNFPEFLSTRKDVDVTEYLPVFIKVRGIESEKVDLTKPLKSNDVEYIINDTIQSVLEKPVKNTEFLAKLKKLIVIDGFEEFYDEDRNANFMYGLKEYYNACVDASVPVPIYIISSRYREFENLKLSKAKILEQFNFEEYIIDELISYPEVIRNFAKKWFDVLERTGNKRDVDRDFLNPVYKNKSVLQLLSSPLELCSTIMLSIFHNMLPSDISQVLEESIKLWLSWNYNPNFHIKDVTLQLSRIAYEMATSSDSRIVINKENLVKIIEKTRKDFARYFVYAQEVDLKSIENFINYINTCGIFRAIEKDKYEFAHRQYSDFLTSFCIKENFFNREERKINRMEYLESYLNQKDRFWDQIIVLIAMQDYYLRDDIIYNLLKLSKENPEENYYLGMLLQLISLPGFFFDEMERTEICQMLLANPERLGLFLSKKEDIKLMLYNSTKEENRIFAKTIIAAVNKTKNEKERGEFENRVINIVFFLIWSCELDKALIEDILAHFFKNHIWESVTQEIKNSYERRDYNQQVVDVIKEAGKKALFESKNKESDYYMLIASICAYEKQNDPKDPKNPYETVLELYKSGDFENQVIATNILILGAWYEETRSSVKNGYIKGHHDETVILPNVYQYLCKGLINPEYENVFRDYACAFEDLAVAGLFTPEKYVEEKLTEDVFHFLVDKMRKQEKVLDEEEEYTRSYSVLAVFPLNDTFLRLGQAYAKQKVFSEEAIRVSKAFLETKQSSKMAIFAFKLLCLFNEIPENERLEKFEKLSRLQGINLMKGDTIHLWDQVVFQLTGSEKAAKEFKKFIPFL